MIDFVLKGFAIISTIIATLRAGSRAIYISEHQAIGLVDGPTIISPPPLSRYDDDASVVAAPIRKSTVNSNSTAIVEIPTTTTTTTTIPDTQDTAAAAAAAATTKSKNQNNFNPALYELAENFKHCVRVSSPLSSTSSYKVEEDIYENIRYDRIQQDVINSSGKEDLPSNNKHSPRRRRRSSSSILQQLLPHKLSEILYRQQQQKRRNTSRQRKDPFNNDHLYKLGYTSYEPKTFKDNKNKQYVASSYDETAAIIEDEALSALALETEAEESEEEKSQLGSNNTNTTTMSFTSKIPSFIFQPFNSIKMKVDNSRIISSSSSFLHKNIGQKGNKFWNYWTSTSSTASVELWNYLSSTSSSTIFDEEDEVDYDDDECDERSWDYGRATEADYFYDVGITTTTTSTSSATIDETDTNNRQRRHIRKRKRLAELTSYCPKTFYDLRTSIFGISEEKYIESIVKNQLVSFQSNSKGAARSGGIFFFTKDGAYMIKTIPNREKNTLLQILPKYHEHMKRYGRSSLLTRFCGMYGIKIQQEEEDHMIVDADGSSSKSRNDININIENDDDTGTSTTTTSLFAPIEKEYTFIVMNAVFPPEANKFISERFDLKGSTVGREVSEEELKSKGSQAVLKDLDLCREREVDDLVKKRLDQNQNQMQQQKQQLRLQFSSSSNSGGGGNIFSRWNQNKQAMKEDYSDAAAAVGGFTIGATAKAALLSQLRKDVKLLIDCQVMDYSLLVGIVHRDNDDEHDHENNNNNNNNAELLKTLKEQNKILERLEGPSTTGTAAANTNNKKIRRIRRPKLLHPKNILYTITTPIRLLLSPPIWFGRKIWDVTRVITVDTIVTYPMPYYGSGICGVDGGQFSVMHGKRKGHRAIYYMGLIDFLQPWSTRKVFERKLKGLAGYDTTAISAVTPEEYATRFLDFLDQNIN